MTATNSLRIGLIFTLFLMPLSVVRSGILQNQVDQLSLNEKQIKQAKALFKQTCIRCHGVDGRGETTQGEIVGATDLTRAEWQERVDDSRVLTSITHGRGEMPAFEKKLTTDQIKLLSAYVRTLKNDVTSR